MGSPALVQLKIAEHFVLHAARPEDVFGKLKGTTKEAQEKEVNDTAKMLLLGVHPDKFSTEKALKGRAEEVTKVITDMEVRAYNLISQGDYGKTTTHAVLGGKYHRYKDLAKGDLADLHNAYFEEVVGSYVEVVLKAARDPADKCYMQQERESLQSLHKAMDGKQIDQCIPKFYDTFMLTGPEGDRVVNVLEALPGWYNCTEIRSRLVGIDGRTLVWMWKRLLTVLSNVHYIGYLHGAMLPPHILFFPDNEGEDKDPRHHTVRVIDWCYSVKRAKDGKSKFHIWLPNYKGFYPPEVLDGKAFVGRRSDVYMAAMTMLYLCGGNVSAKTWPKDIPDRLKAVINKCVVKDMTKRPADAGAAFDEFAKAAVEEYGKPKYHDFILPEADYDGL